MKKDTPSSENFVSQEIEKKNIHIVVEIVEYVAKSVVSRTIIKKSTGNITVSSFDAGEEQGEKISPFDVYVQIIDGAAELMIGTQKFDLKSGDGIVVPAHQSHHFNANEQFKMVSTVIKCGYED